MTLQPGILALWALTVLLDSGGQLAFKAAAGNPDAGSGLGRWRFMLARPWIWIGAGFYLFEFLAWTAFLSLVPLGRGVLLGSINIVAILLAGRWLFGERLTRMRIIGISLITLGVALVGASS
ncbi:MAG: EamA family transporter [Rhodanobacteraceae bacterium]